MSGLFLPPRVARELLDERKQFTRAIWKACATDLVCTECNTELQRLDPRLRMVKAPEYLVIGMPLTPGYYHLVRDNESAPPSITVVQGPGGEFRVPGEWFLDKLRGLDLQNGQVVMAHRIQQKRAQQAEERDKLNTREARQGSILERFKAVSRTQVSMNNDTVWAQNSRGHQRTRGMHRRPAA